jgi:hypothetical protein
MQGRRALRSSLTSFLTTAASEADLDVALAPIIARGFIERHEEYVPHYLELPFEGAARIRIPRGPEEPEEGEQYFTPTMIGLKAAMLCAGLNNPTGLVPGWLLGEGRLHDEVVLAIARANTLEAIDIWCCRATTHDVRVAVERAEALKLIERHEGRYRLTIEGEARQRQLREETRRIAMRLSFPAVPQGVPPALQLRPERKQELLNRLNEAELSVRVLIPLLRSLGFFDVEYKNGPQERGKDIVGWKPDELGHATWLAVVAKAKDINGAAQGNDSIITVVNQIEQALYDEIHLAPAVEAIRMHRCWVMTSGRFVGDAMSKVAERLKQTGMSRVVRWVDGERLVRMIDQCAPHLWADLLADDR